MFKMLLYWGIILLSLGGILGETCWERYLACQEDLPHDFPQTDEDLEFGCSVLQTTTKCILDVLENCVNEFEIERIKAFNEKRIAVFTEMEQSLLEFCNPNSSIYQVIVRNLECAYPILKNSGGSCDYREQTGNRKKVVDTYIELLRENFHDVWNCASAIWRNACAATLASDKCGFEVLHPLTEILNSLDYNVQMTCDQEIKDGIHSFVEVLALADEADVVENEIENKK